ncbi:MAG: tetratricopeptide repeat protein, partial [Chitinophagales bacterium]
MKSFTPYLYIIVCLFLSPLVFSHTSVTDSLAMVWKEVGNENEDDFAVTFETVKKLQLSDEKLVEVKTTLENTLVVCQNSNNFSKKSKLHALLANVYILKSANEKAYESLQKALQIGKNALSKKERILVLKRIAELSLTMGKYEDAYSYRLQILKIYEELEDKEGIYATLYNVGSIFFYQENFPQALIHYQKAREMAEEARDSSILYRSLAAIGSVYGELEDSDQSLDYNLKSLRMAESMKFDMGIAYSAHNVGLNYEILGLPEKALSYFEQALQLMQKMGDKFGQANCLQAISKIHSQNKHHKKAIDHLTQALTINQQLGDLSRIRELYLDMSKTYFDAGNSVKAYEVQKNYIELRDSLIKEETMQQMANLKQAHELEKKENEKQIAIMESEQEIEQIYRYVFLVGLSFLLLAAWLFYSRYQEQTAMNKLLAQKNEEIQLQNNKLATSNRELEQFAYIASHDLKEPLRNIGGFTSLLERRYLAEGDEDAKDFMR